MDTLTPKQRSSQMSLIRYADTKPELAVRRLIFRLGYRYRLHVHSIPGTPDIIFQNRNKVIFVHGCFWHRHVCVNGKRLPKSRVAFWRAKLEGNKPRDRRNHRILRRLGWKVLVVWECQIKNIEKLMVRLKRFLG